MTYWFRENASGGLDAVHDTSPDATMIDEGWTEFAETDATAQAACNDLADYSLQNGLLVNTPVSDATKLENAQSGQMSHLVAGLQATLSGGFTAKTLVGGATSPHTYPTDASAQANFTGAVTAFTANPNKTTVTIETLDTGWISHTKTEFYGVYSDGDTWKEAQYTQYTSLVNQVKAATTVSAVQAITWTPATY